ncbi:MAG: cation-transporting P-type ATPase [Thiohalomonadaceae bacterium]
MNRTTDTLQGGIEVPAHALDIDTLFTRWQSSQAGLTTEEARQRLQEHGPNRLPPPARRTALMRFLLQFHNVLIYLLLGSAVITALLEEWVDTGVIIGVVVINAIVGFLQEGKAEKALEAVSGLLTPTCTVLRDGSRRVMPAEELVPGDVVILQSGDRVPADLRLFRSRELRIEEAALTGESVPVEKNTAAMDANAPIGDRLGMAYTGTLVTYGQGTGLVVATGEDTELGRISKLLTEVQPLTTPLLRQIDHFGHWLTWAILAIAAASFTLAYYWRDFDVRDSFLAAVGLAVAAIPEGLPAIMTITLAIGVQRMARRHAIIRRLPAVETLGSVTVICTDKTGTLTRNEMTVARLALAEGDWRVTGVGYAPAGDLVPVDGAGGNGAVEELVRAGLLCNEAGLEHAAEGWRVHGDPTEGALVVLAAKLGLDPETERRRYPRTDEIPFESQHKFMATLHHDHAGHGYVFVKGAPESVIDMCSHERHGADARPLRTTFWRQKVDEFAAEGHRVLALATLPTAAGRTELGFPDVQNGLTLLGLVGIIDPPREEAIESVALCRSAGIRVKMITGDHVATANSIAAQLGIGEGQAAVTGPELEHLDGATLEKTVAETDVFARTSPEHKLRLVEALQRRGEITAMTGDGVNDAPALKRANVGVAMGKKGTDAAREASQMVLTDDNFATIVHAVEEGRTIHDNLTKAILFVLPTNMGQASVIITAILFGMVMPITPVQILWVNMVSAVTLALVLAFEPGEAGVMRRPPRDPRAPIISPMLAWRVVFVSVILVVGSLVVFQWELSGGASLEAARVATVNTLVMGQIFYLFSARYVFDSSIHPGILKGNPALWPAIVMLLGLQVLFTYFEPMKDLFGTGAIGPDAWLHTVAVGFLVFVVAELEKWAVRKYRARH